MAQLQTTPTKATKPTTPTKAAKAKRPKRPTTDTDSADRQSVALKAFARVAAHWSLTTNEAAALADMSESTWKRARGRSFSGRLSVDQMLRLSALIGLYKSLQIYFGGDIAKDWVKLPNQGPEFKGARPLDSMVAGGLPKILAVRHYVDALRGGL